AHKGWEGSVRNLLGRRIPTRALADATRSLAVMVAARLPLVDALRTTARQSDHNRLSAVLSDVARRVERGQPFAASLERHPKVFSPLFGQLVREGELAGALDAVLLRLADHLEKAEALRRKVRMAMMYPAIVLAVALATVTFLLTVIVPTFADMFADFGADLPLPTRIVLGVTDVLQAYGWIVLLALVGVVVLARGLRRDPRVQRAAEQVRLRLPVLGPLYAKGLTARVCRTLGTLVESGVALDEALRVTATSSESLLAREATAEMRRRVVRGTSLAAPMAHASFFPPMVVQMVSVGEETARLSEMLLHVARHYEAEVDAAVEALASVIEPLLVVVLGIIVGAILVAIYLPMFELTNVIQ
ncbi:MAG: type II secretion system F family protein, partial [Bacteroidota bacterium]